MQRLKEAIRMKSKISSCTMLLLWSQTEREPANVNTKTTYCQVLAFSLTTICQAIISISTVDGRNNS